MGFSEIIGHGQALQSLRTALARDRLHHAYLFLGLDGVGKRTVAVALAKALHCREINDDYCGICSNCVRIESRNHPDVRLIEPGAGKKEISIQQIREIERELSFRSFCGRKIVIIDPAGLMSIPAQNALLKTLEEPPVDSLLVLVSQSGGSLLPTLRSRCLRVSFGPLPRAVIADFVEAKTGIPRAQAEWAAAMSMGRVGAALELDQTEFIEQRRSWIEMMSSLVPGDYRAAFHAAEALSADREETLRFLAWAETWYRDLLVYEITQDDRELINLDAAAEIRRQSAVGRRERLLGCLNQAAGATARIQRNLNRRMVLEELFVGTVEEQ